MTYDRHAQVNLAVFHFWDEGEEAFKEGKSIEDNPYLDGDGWAKAPNGIDIHAKSHWESGWRRGKRKSAGA